MKLNARSVPFHPRWNKWNTWNMFLESIVSSAWFNVSSPLLYKYIY